MIKRENFRRFYKHIFFFVAFLVVGNYLIGFATLKQKDIYLNMQTELLTSKYKTNYQYFKIMSQDIYSIYEDNSAIITLLAKAKHGNDLQRDKLRTQLYKKLNRRYKRLKNMGVLQLHFHLPNNVSFLRMHKPEKFGDDLTLIRESVKLTNQTKTPQEGFEIGKIVHGFRFVYPLFNKQEHIGSMEISFGSHKLVESIIDRTILHTHFLVLKDEVEKKIFKALKGNLYTTSLESPDYLLENESHVMDSNTNVDKGIFNKKFISKITQNMQMQKAFSLASSFNKETTIGSFIPIMNLQNTQAVAYLALYTESDYLDNLDMEKQYIKMLFVTVLFLLFLFSVYVTLNNVRLQRMAHFDELTTLPNRAYFYIQLEIELNRAKRLNNKLAVMFIDLDGFKAVNDTYGHNMGDKLLVAAAQRLRSCVRNIDIVARLGGDEFTIVLCDIKEDKDAIDVANKIIKTLGKSFIIDKQLVNIGASIGISLFPQHAKDSDTLIKESDTAMYKAKENGKNCAVVSNKELN